MAGEVDGGVEAGSDLIKGRRDAGVAGRNAAGIEDVDSHSVGSKQRAELELARRDVGVLPLGLGGDVDLEHHVTELLLGLLWAVIVVVIVGLCLLVGRVR